MANDRIFLVDKISGKRMCFAKHLGAGWYTVPDIQERLDNFFEETEDSFWGNNHYVELQYED